MLAADAEFGLRGHPVDLLAHLVERGIDAVALGLGILGDGMLDGDARLVEAPRWPRAMPVDQLQPRQPHRRRSIARAPAAALRVVDQPGIGDQLGQHHRDGLQRLDLDIVIFARVDMLDRRARRSRASRRMIGTPAKLWNFSSPVSGL